MLSIEEHAGESISPEEKITPPQNRNIEQIQAFHSFVSAANPPEGSSSAEAKNNTVNREHTNNTLSIQVNNQEIDTSKLIRLKEYSRNKTIFYINDGTYRVITLNLNIGQLLPSREEIIKDEVKQLQVATELTDTELLAYQESECLKYLDNMGLLTSKAQACKINVHDKENNIEGEFEALLMTSFEGLKKQGVTVLDINNNERQKKDFVFISKEHITNKDYHKKLFNHLFKDAFILLKHLRDPVEHASQLPAFNYALTPIQEIQNDTMLVNKMAVLQLIDPELDKFLELRFFFSKATSLQYLISKEPCYNKLRSLSDEQINTISNTLCDLIHESLKGLIDYECQDYRHLNETLSFFKVTPEIRAKIDQDFDATYKSAKPDILKAFSSYIKGEIAKTVTGAVIDTKINNATTTPGTAEEKKHIGNS